VSTARVGILASGRGSNFVALDAAMRRAELPAEIVVVLSNRRDAPVLEKAAHLGIPGQAIDAEARLDQEQALIAALVAARVEWVCLAGYMRVLGAGFVSTFPERILNIHPSLLPAFPGLAAQRQAIEHGVTISGCTVHFVDHGLDTGPIVGQAAVPVAADDDTSTLAQRILEAEHQLYPQCLRRLLTEPWRLEGRRVRWGPSVVA
jgi:phosphoribosylglycinamide formyltransferase-1